MVRLQNRQRGRLIAEHSIQHLPRGNTPSMVTLEALCKAFGITMAQFFAEGEMIEITPELRELFDKWTVLTPEQKTALWQIIKTYEK